MKPVNWKDIAEFVGITAIVASLIFVGLQLKQDARVALNDFGVSRSFAQYEVNSSINEYADIWARGNAGEELDRAERVIYTNLIEDTYARAYWGWQPVTQLGRSGEVSVHTFAVFLFRNPGARETWESQIEIRRTYRDPLFSDSAESEGGVRALRFPILVFEDLAKLDALFGESETR
jgi:hypothetical protein